MVFGTGRIDLVEARIGRTRRGEARPRTGETPAELGRATGTIVAGTTRG